MSYFISNPGPENSGIYFAGRNIAYIDPKYMDDPDTIVHETIHSLRYNDGERKGVVTSGKSTPLSDQDRTLEEAATHAETITRISPFGWKDPSYYGLIPTNSDANTLLIKDRKLFTGKLENKGLKGDVAVRAVEDNFSGSEIGKLKLNKARLTANDYAEKLKNKEKIG